MPNKSGDGFGPWFQRQRDLMDKTQDEVAAELDINKVTLSRIENGSNVSPDLVKRLARCVGADEEEAILRAFAGNRSFEPDAVAERELRRLARMVPTSKRDVWIRAVRSITEAVTV